MRRPLVFTLLLLTAFQAAGWLLAWTSLWLDARATARRRLEQAETALVTRTLHRTDFVKARVERHEVRLNGQLYDIKNLSVEGDSVHLVLFHDWHEQYLLNALTGLLSAQPDHQHPGPFAGWLAQVLGAVFLPPAAPVLPTVAASRPDWAPKAAPCLLRPAQHVPGLTAPPPWRD